MSARIVRLLGAATLAACATAAPQRSDELPQARSLYSSLVQSGASRRVDADMERAKDAIARADSASRADVGVEYQNAVAHIALRMTQAADAKNAALLERQTADSLRAVRLSRLLNLSESQREALAAQNQLSQSEIAALRERNVAVSAQADSLRQANAAANARLDSALTQLRSLVSEITDLKETSRGVVISLSDILFDVNKATLKPGAEQSVRRIAAVLKQYPDHRISVEGHTDATGSDVYSQKLSEDRAAAVRTTLISGGIDPSRIDAHGFGKSQPVATNATPSGRQQNRRVEVIVVGAGKVADAMRARQQGGDSGRAPADSARQRTPGDSTQQRPPSPR